ncbi:uncharacterized protein EV154DRAFT_486121 [Mucor mucedo]|uniref:uncharacterized protein n=1 Tax=Mucor mucedo TaxID=29922 RepID=UPI00221E5F50|nr:uncharacterized protein EV154DRAFT_486121 [Mucor mucedo]KAI7878986.1 hypothetical protein EV154DRAFT_486121 [Mucor mucedo]
MRALEFIREPVKKSVARCFYRQNIITEDQLKKILTGRNMNEAMGIFQEPATEEQPIGGDKICKPVNVDGSNASKNHVTSRVSPTRSPDLVVDLPLEIELRLKKTKNQKR